MEETKQPKKALTAEEITQCLNEAFQGAGYDVSVTLEQVQPAFNKTDKTYHIYGFKSTKGDTMPRQLLSLFPEEKSGMVFMVSLDVYYKCGPGDFIPQDIPNYYWAIDFSSGEILTWVEVYEKYPPKRRGEIPQA